eukprot:gene12392-3050_t
MGRKSKTKDEENGDSESKLDTTTSSEISDRPSYEELVKKVSIISKPLASKKLTKKLYKTVKKATKEKCLRRGVKEVAKALRKNEKGFVILAGDVSPIDVISHLPILCENNKMPYCFVPSRLAFIWTLSDPTLAMCHDLGLASQTKRPTSVVLVKENEAYKEYYKDCYSEMDSLPLPL